MPPRSRPRAMSRSGVRIPSCSETRPKVGHVLGSVSRVHSRRRTGGIPTTFDADIGPRGPREGEEAAEAEEEEEAGEGLSRFRLFSSLGDVVALHILVVGGAAGPTMSPAERSAKRIEAVYDALACQAIVRANGLVRRRWDVYHSIDCRYVISCIVMGRRFCAGGERRAASPRV